jgi:hypothetical protein
MNRIMEWGLWKSPISFPYVFHTFPTAFPQEKVTVKVFIDTLLRNLTKFSTFPWPLDFSF